MTTIPRSELSTVARRYGVDYDFPTDPYVDEVRRIAAGLRGAVSSNHGGFAPTALIAEADELDALADRYTPQATA